MQLFYIMMGTTRWHWQPAKRLTLKVRFRLDGSTGGKNIGDIDISHNDITAECTLSGYSGNDEISLVINYCVLIAKYYIYIQKLVYYIMYISSYAF